VGILFFAAPGGIVMSFFIDRGPLVLLSFVVQCSLWVYCTTVALNAIRNRDFQGHEQWMMRSFSLTLAAITLRLYILGVSGIVDLNQPTAYAVLAWLSWLPNFLTAELIIRKKITSALFGIQRT
jgi:hypothetical protein